MRQFYVGVGDMAWAHGCCWDTPSPVTVLFFFGSICLCTHGAGCMGAYKSRRMGENVPSMHTPVTPLQTALFIPMRGVLGRERRWGEHDDSNCVY